MEDILKKISTLSLFNGIDITQFSSFFAGIKYYKKTYQKNTALILQGMPYKALYIMISGRCVGQMSDSSGKIIKIEDFEAPYALASALLFSDDNHIPVTVWAKTTVELLIIKKEDLIFLCLKNKLFLLNLLNDIANKFSFISNKLMYLQFKSLEEKILYYLHKQNPDFDGFITLKKSIQELSNIFGVERPSLSRTLARMHKKGLIVRYKKRIKLICLKA
ncbi:MAG: Crp/Fnr family transcriptional regulator [Spirochaetales bacterium]|nr:Crp/Fnr family transcriptional regulator [Spirochaetales bacterium]